MSTGPSPRTPYCSSRFTYRRRPTRQVSVGPVGIGSTNPIRVQSMTSTPTADVRATVDQIERLAAAECEIVRLTVAGGRDVEALPDIRREMFRRHLSLPLVADVHYSPGAALRVVESVEKIRINPGNYAARRWSADRGDEEAAFRRGAERIRERLIPLVDRARDLGVAMRIGVNHGSLADRIVHRFGDTPLGMVESALEFVRICEDRGYRDLVLSMKSSNPQVMIRAYRLLAATLAERGGDYPFHLGVTEAGAGEEGRTRSAVGIGTLLDDGLGDTIRVSLTEDPVREIPVAFRLVRPYNERGQETAAGPPPDGVVERIDPFSFQRRATASERWGPVTVGGDAPVRVELLLDPVEEGPDELATRVRRLGGEENGAEVVEVPVRDTAAVARLTGAMALLEARCRSRDEVVAPGAVDIPAVGARVHRSLLEEPRILEILGSAVDRLDLELPSGAGRGDAEARLLDLLPPTRCPVLLEGRIEPGVDPVGSVDRLVDLARHARSRGLSVAVSLQCARGTGQVAAYRCLAARLDARDLDLLLVLRDDLGAGEDPRLDPSRRLGSLLIDGLGDAIRLHGLPPPWSVPERSYDILQATRRRISRVEYISCPSCGRTLFDLERVTAEVRSRTAHLRDLKIAIMGCVVNGPGEMADADFGYVGSGPGRVALYRGRECLEKDVPEEEAPQRLVELIRRAGRWCDPPTDRPSR